MDVLIVVDMQNDFIDGALGSKMAQAIVENVNQKVKEAEENGKVIIFTKDTHYENYLDTEEGKNLPVPHCIVNTEGWEIADKIKVPNDANILQKNTFGAKFLSDYLLMCDNIKNIELVGLCTDICVISNAIVAKTAEPNAHIIVDASCCAGVTPKSHDTALSAMKTLQIEVINQGKEPWR